MTGTLALDQHLRIDLRDYQTDALTRTTAAEARGVRKQLGVAATGLGKTIMFAALAELRGDRTLILVHRDELVRQAVDKVQQVWPDVEVGIVKAGDNDVDAHVVVASVQTVSRANRLAQLLSPYQNDGLPREPFGLVVVDEAHHATADTYRTILDALGCGADPPCPLDTDGDGDCAACTGSGVGYPGCTGGKVHATDAPLLLGVTATPDRGDGLGLDGVFDEIVWNYDMLWGIRSGYLCDVRGLRVRVQALDLSQVKVRRGDYEQGAAGRAMEDAHAPEAIVAAWRKHADQRRTLVFTPTVEVARLTANEYRRTGTPAAYVHAGTPLEERRAMLRSFNSGDVQVIANCGVLTEGFDEPRVDCIVVARPTKSRALFTQMVGRGTRKHPDKTDLLVLDVVGNSDTLSLVTIPSLFGVDDPELIERLSDGTTDLTDVMADHEQRQIAIGKMRAEEADLFGKERQHGLVWLNATIDDQRRYHRPLGYNTEGEWVDLGTVVLVEREGGWLCGIAEPNGAKRVLIADVDLELAQGVGEDAARKLMGHRAQLVTRGAAWRKRPPTERQLHAAKRWRLPNAASYKTAGDLSEALDAHIERKKARQAAKEVAK